MKNLISKAGRAIALQAVIFASCFAISTAHAEMPPLPQQMWEAKSDSQIAEDARRDPNKYCTQCHETANATGKPFSHAGKHFQHGTKSPNSGEQVTCVSCHGNMSENHRKGVRDVMRFSKMDQKVSKPELERTVHEQNQVCVACHTADKLREKFWAHDTHANKIACANCHELHPEKDPMKAIPEKQRIKLCTDCHTKIQAHKEEVKAQEAKENQ
jgi:cytochrome c nitrite reductase, pentaheme subunit